MSRLQTINEKIGRYRWTICSLLFFATTVNYLDRQVLSLLKDSLEIEYNWTDSDYANITLVFQAVYSLSMLFAGRFIDWLGTKWGYAWSLIIWSIAAMGHALARGTGGFMFARGLLGFGEAGNFPAAIKATAEYFPKKERSLATGIFNSGSNIGAILAPLIVPWMAKHWGWQTTFLLVGGIGFLWLIFWFWLYEIPSKQKRLNKNEYDYILSDNDQQVAPSLSNESSTTKTQWYKEWGQLLRYKQTWSFAFGKFITDGVWWFFLFWLPAYLKAVYGMTGTSIAFPLAILYTMTCIGSIGGGALPMYFIKKGYEPYSGRMRAMLIIALFPLFVLLAQPLGVISYWLPVLLIGIGASAHQAWSANVFTTVSDMFPKKSVASVTGIGGMVGGIGGIIINKTGGWLFDAYRATGIAEFWEKVSHSDMAPFAEKVKGLHLLNRHGYLIDLHTKDLINLPKEAVLQIQSDVCLSLDQIKEFGLMNKDVFVEATKTLTDPALVEQYQLLVDFQQPIVQNHMSVSYSIMFAFCAVAYILGWAVMKLLVPKFKPI